ncbi:hypothetical protein QTI60_05390 [Clostridium perfringens]|uniref:hypothetical protein n=1 Tax=Clostridium perfringens TaxID=1502 RepID=UPI0028CC41A3|nr:hypothetical protein [Clostridium perfringens]MDM0514735.1 hypothetical protein [Clostridium perfringens]MDM0881674.1 hypothetical protein [Clostridium perfringens]MDT7983946.1 hypothetical protein [Clostridium perfringens]MDT8039462.1 hypothetical protein [Clostridium perfringens]
MENKIREKLIDKIIELIVNTFEKRGIKPTISSVELILEDAKKTLSWIPVSLEAINEQKDRMHELLNNPSTDD